MPVDDKPIRRGSKAKQGKPGEEDEDWMDKDLAEDAVWKKIQQNTFTRWANEHLKTVNKHITDLATDFSDGIRLIALVEVLAGKKIGNYNKRPKVRAQKIENVNIALQFLKNEEKIRIVNIDSIDVVDGKVKLICGVMWMLILHYSISMPMWEGEDESMYKEKGGPTPKQRLLGWIQNKVPDVPINNFTSDWNNGIALGALVDSCAPGLCPDWDKWKPQDGLKNVTQALKTAEEYLNVAPLVAPEEMVNPKVDELSMMTYLSQFPNAKLKTGAPTKPRHNPKRVRCYGPGIQKTGVNVGAKTNFTVETYSAGDGEVQVFLKDPTGKQTPIDAKFNDDDAKTYTCTYAPKMEGPHKVIVKYSGVEVPKSPFDIEVKGNPGDPAKVKCEGPGLKPKGAQVGKQSHFDIDTTNAGVGQVEVQITDPKGKINSVPLRVRQDGDDEKKYRCEYVPQLEGPHQISVNFAGKPVPNSPFKTTVAPPCDPRKVRALGRGLQPTGVRVNDLAEFRVLTDGAGSGTPTIKVIGPDGKAEKVTVLKAKDGTTYNCDYKPLKEGKYVVEISFGDQEIFQSPFEVQVGPMKESKVAVYGPGLKGGLVGYPAKFTVDTNGETGTLGFSVEGPSYAKIECKDNGDGSAEVTYHPTAPGEYAVHVTVDGDDIPNSPYCPIIKEKADFKPELVEATGPGLNAKGVVIAKPTEFTVDTRKAGGKNVPVDISVMNNSDYREVETKITDNKDGTYKVKYTPDKLGKHTVQVNYGGVSISKSPFRVEVGGVADPSKIKLYGPGLEKGVKPGKQTHFVVDARSAGGGDLVPVIKDEKGSDLPVEVTDHQNGQYTVDYTAPAPGKYKINATFAGKQIPKLPIDINVTPPADVSKVKVTGLEPIAMVETMQTFRVRIGDGCHHYDEVSVLVDTPTTGTCFLPAIMPDHGGFAVRHHLRETGTYMISVLLNSIHVTGSPFKVEVLPIPLIPQYRFDSSEDVRMIMEEQRAETIRAFGPGLRSDTLRLNHVAEFIVDLKDSLIRYGPPMLGHGLKVVIEGPCEAAIHTRYHHDGTCSVAYMPTAVGVYNVSVLYDDQFVSALNAFTVDARGTETTGDGKVSASVKTPSGKKVNTFVENKNDGTYKVTYILPEEGEYTFDVKYDDAPVPGTPAKVKATAGFDAKRVKVYGPGIEKGFVKQPNEFTIETLGAGNGGLGLGIQGPTEPKVKCLDNRNGTCTVSYIPEDGGDYDITVKFGDQHVPGSPFTVPVQAEVDASKVTATGAGVDPNNCRAAEQLTFKVDARKSAKAPLAVEVTTDKGPIAEAPIIKDNGNGTYDVSYKPPPEGSPCNVKVTYGGKDIKGSTYQMKVKKKSEPKKVKVSGPGVGKQVQASLPTEFMVDTREAGFGDMVVTILDPRGKPIRYFRTDFKDGTYKITYTPEDIGEYKVSVKFDGEEVAPPFPVNSVQTGDADKCKIGDQLKEKIKPNEEVTVNVDTKDAGPGALTCKVTRVQSQSESSETTTERVESTPDGGTRVIRETRRETKTSTQRETRENIDCKVVKNADGTYSVKYKVQEPGNYTIELKYGGKPVPNGVINFVVD
ncbi:hypothetical protein BLOT_012377 [Blomia tropicalis]|nr:hypothetical protein BLOT_012377 [Blomia tropicalis]